MNNLYTLDQICKKITDGSHQSPKEDPTGYPMVSVKDMTEFGFDLSKAKHISKNDFEKLVKQGCKPEVDDILIAKDGSVMKHIFRVRNADNIVLLSSIAILRPNKEIVYPDFLVYSLKNNRVKEDILNNYVSGSGVPRIVLKDFKKVELDIPNLNLQINISKKLRSLDDKIQLNTQINQTLEQIAHALFKSWFVNFDPVRAKVQAISDGLSLEQAELAAMQAISGKTPEELTALSQAEPDRYAELAETAKAFPCEMVEIDGSEVPKGWEVKELRSLMTIKRGGSPRPIKDFISDKGLNWVKISDATAEDNPFLFSTKEYIKSEGLSKTVLLNKGSLILSNSATPGLPRFLELDACIHDGWLYFSDIKRLTQEYLYFFFLNIRNDLVAQGNGSVFTNLKTDIVKAQKAIVPDERAIYYFDKQVKSIMNLIKYNTANSISLKEIRDLLLPRLLNGELNG